MTGRITSVFERLLFGHRAAFLVLFAVLSGFMAWSASRLHIDAGFAKQLPRDHEFIRTYVQYQDQFGGANRVIIALMVKEGDIFTAEYIDALQKLTDEVFFLPGVDRASVTSLVTPNVRFLEVVEDGLAGGNVVPADFEPTPEGLAEVRANVIKSGRVGQLVANNFNGSIIMANLLEVDPSTGAKIDYFAVARHLEENVRSKYAEQVGVFGGSIHIIGFAKAIGDIADGARSVILFFGISLLLTTIFVRIYSISFRLTVLPLGASVVAVVWQLGVLPLFGYGIDPMSILVPFLVFAIGVSHGVQMIRCFRNAVFEGASPMEAARSAFRQLFIPGGVALITDTIGFLTILFIRIDMLRELAITASLGVAAIIVTNIFLLPVLLSYVQLRPEFAQQVRSRTESLRPLWAKLDVITRTGPSLAILIGSLILLIFGAWKARQVSIGDLHAGLPELRADSRYNQDTKVITSNFSIGVDLLTVLVETVPNGCVEPDVMDTIDRFQWHVANVPGVQSTTSVASYAQVINAGWNEGSLKWRMLPGDAQTLALSVTPIETSTGLLNADGSVLPVHIFLADHKATTVADVVAAVKEFERAHGSERAHFRLATGNAGVMAATNEVVAAAQTPILAWVFASVIVLCLLTFRSWRATLCIVYPLAMVSVLASALMVWLDIGLKVSTLPVASLGVGIGVDYGIYLYSRLEEYLEKGAFFEDAMLSAYTMTGSAVIFTGITLGAGVSTWIFSDLKFQADMGILLTFMFLVNMLGAIIVMPAMARWLFRHHSRNEA